MACGSMVHCTAFALHCTGWAPRRPAGWPARGCLALPAAQQAGDLEDLEESVYRKPPSRPPPPPRRLPRRLPSPTTGRLETSGPTMGRPPAARPPPPPPPPPPPRRPPTMGRPPTRLPRPPPPTGPPPPVSPPPLPELSWPGRKLTKGRLLSVSPRPGVDAWSADAPPDCAANAGMVPAAPRAKLRAAT